jgi:hypothetical protein
LEEDIFIELDDEYEKIILMLNSMEMKAKTFCFATS